MINPESIQSKDDVAQFIRELHTDLLNNPERWENADLPAFLQALSAWIADSDGYFANHNLPQPDAEAWRLVVRVLLAAKSYE